MSYRIENVFICLVAPFLIAAFCSNSDNRKNYIFIVLGMLCCIVSAYLNTFFVGVYKAENSIAAVEITPVIEETVKLLPLLFYLFVFEAETNKANNAAFNVAIGFATFENICYLVENGADNLSHILIRGFSTGAMHIVCAFVIGYGIRLVWQKTWLEAAGLAGLLCVSITYHAIFNMLMWAGGTAQHIGYLIPIATILFQLILKKCLKNRIGRFE